LPPSEDTELAILDQWLGKSSCVWVSYRRCSINRLERSGRWQNLRGNCPNSAPPPALDYPPIAILCTRKMNSNTTHPGVLHRISRPGHGDFPPPLVAFEHGNSPNTSNANTLIFLGGLFDGLLTVPFVQPVVKALPSSWTLVEPTLSSAYIQWGFATLGEDIAEIAILVDYFRGSRPGKILHTFGALYRQPADHALSPIFFLVAKD